MQSAKFEFVLKKNKDENRILNCFTLSSCKLRLTLTFKSQFEQFPYIAQNSTTYPGPFLSIVALNLKSRESKDAKQ